MGVVPLLLTPGFARDPLYLKARQIPAFDLCFFNQTIVDRISGITPTFTRPSSTKLAWNGSTFVTYAADVPAFQYNPTTGRWGYLHEPAATNLAIRSTEFDNAAWTKIGLLAFGAGSVANSINGLDGTLSADLIVESTASGDHYIEQNFSAVSGTTYTWSCFAKPFGGKTTVMMRFTTGSWSGGSSNQIRFDLTTGATTTVSGTGTAVAVPYPDGWWRISLTSTASATASPAARLHLIQDGGASASYVGTGTSGAYLWCGQPEAGSVASSPIITVASAVTRAADTMTVTGTDFSRWYNQAGGVLYANGRLSGGAAASFPYQVAATGADANNDLFGITWTANAGQMRGGVISGGVVSADIAAGSSLPSGSEYAAAVSASSASAQCSSGGALGAEDASVTLPTATRLTIGGPVRFQPAASTLFYRVAYFPLGPAINRLQSLTA